MFELYIIPKDKSIVSKQVKHHDLSIACCAAREYSKFHDVDFVDVIKLNTGEVIATYVEGEMI